MADRIVVEALTREMVQTISRKVAGPDFAAAVDTYCRHFTTTDNEALAAAVTRWQETVENPHSLPAVRTLRAHLGRTVQVQTRLADLPFVAPRAEFVDAHRRFRDQVTARKHRPHLRHTHDGDHCRECDQIRAGLDELAVLAAVLPEPAEGSPRPCRCDGSGLVDTAASWRAVFALAADEVAASVREVFPCPRCCPIQFEAWQSGQVAA